MAGLPNLPDLKTMLNLNVEKAKKMANLNPLTSLVKGVKTTIDTIKKKKKATKVDISREKAAQVDNTIVGKKKKV